MQPVITGRPRYSVSNFFSFIRTPRASTRKAASEAKGSEISFFGSDPSDRFPLRDANVDFAGQLPDHLHLVDLRQLLQGDRGPARGSR